MKHLGPMICVLLLLLGCGDDGNESLDAPANLTAAVVAEDRVDLSWEDRSGNESGFEVQRSHQGEAFRVLTRTTADATAVSDATVALGEIYTYRVRAVSGSERSYFSNTIEVEVVVDRATPPMAPTSLQASEVAATSLTLTWVDGAVNETGFEIERAVDEDFAAADTLAADMNETRYEEGNLTPETGYYYRIRAINAVGESAWSEPLAVETEALPLTPPAAPASVSAEAVSPTRIDLSWQDNSANEAGFTLMVSLDGTNFETLATTGANVRTYAHAQLTPETTYTYYLFAFNSAGDSDRSDTAQATTPAEPVAPPTAPTDLAYSELSSNAVRLTWTDTADNEEGFRLERSEDSDFDLVDAVTLDPNATSHRDNDLLPDTTYYYRVVAFNGDGDSEYSGTISMETPLEIIPLPAPSALAVQDTTATAITLVWQDNSDAEEGFRLFVSTDGGEHFDRVTEVAAEMTLYTHDGLADDTTYHYRLCAYLGQQTSDYSNVVETTTDPLPPTLPEPPGQLEATEVLYNRVTLSWQDNADDETGFTLEKADNDAFTGAEQIELPADQTTYVDTAVEGEMTYHYQIRAVNGAGSSANAGPLTVTTPAEPPVTEAHVADYAIAKESVLRRIPAAAVEAAKADLKIMYCGTSHSSQVVDGMRGLTHYKTGDAERFAVTFGGVKADGALDMHYRPSGVYATAQDLSHDTVDADGHTAYFRETETYLDANTDCNVVMWSWCDISGHDVDIYLDNFAQLIAMYRAGGTKGRTVADAVTFVFMTGYANGGDGDTPEPPYLQSPYQNHKRIRDYCEANGYFCLDYWSQDTYNYGDDSYKPTENGNTNIQHLEWVNAHTFGTDWFECRDWNSGGVSLPAHANQHLTGNRRAYAAWWIFARIAGWDGTLE